jgi:hypothetical protein
MTAGKNKPEQEDTDSPIIIRPLREDAVEQLPHSPKRNPGLKRQQLKNLSTKFRVHKIELAIEE